MTSSRLRRFVAALAASALACTVALVGPVVVSAATVTLTEDTTVTLPSDGSTYTLASGGTFDQLDVSSGTMTFTMTSGESVHIVASNNRVLDNDSGSFTYTCSAQSELTLSPSSSVTIIVTPGSTCTPSSGGNGSSGGGSATPAKPATPASTTPAVPATPAAPAASASGLSAAQIQSILDVLASFNADASIIASVKASLEGVTGGSVTSAAVHVFKANLTVGSLGSEVKALQQYLNNHGYAVAGSGPGSPGNETTTFGVLTKAALAKLQAAAGITPAVGYFGPKTRAYVEAHP
jgi:hypothetical protein